MPLSEHTMTVTQQLTGIRLVRDHVHADGQLDLELTPLERCVEVTCYQWRVCNTGETVFRGTLRIQIEVPGIGNRPWVFVPGLFYGENRRVGQRDLGKRYPRFDPTAEVCIASMTSPSWDFPADKTASPLVLLHGNEQAVALASDPHFTCSETASFDDIEPQVGLGFGVTEGNAYLRLNVPACDEPVTHNNRAKREPTLRLITLPPGASVSGELQVHHLHGPRDLYRKVHRDQRDRLNSHSQHVPAPMPDLLNCVADATYGIVAHHYLPADNFLLYSRPYHPVIEQVAQGRGTTMQWAQMLTGFVGAIPVSRGLLRASHLTGDAEPERVARRLLDRVCREGISPSGLFWGGCTPEWLTTPNGRLRNPLYGSRNDPWGPAWYPGKHAIHARTVADGTAELVAVVEDLQRHAPGLAVPHLWLDAIRSNLDAALQLQLHGGSFGQVYDGRTGEVIEVDGCGGLPWLIAAARAARIRLLEGAEEERWRTACERAAEAYRPYLDNASMWGAPEDNDSASSEDGMNALMAFAELYRWTEEAKWLEMARLAADWMLTFRRTFNQRLPKLSIMGRYDLRSRGGEVASSSNNHLHIYGGVATRDLADLSRWTGDLYYRDEALAIWRFMCQYLSRCDGMFNGFRGAMAEQFYWTDWGSWGNWNLPESHYQKGSMAPFTAVWCLGVLLITAYDVHRLQLLPD